MPPRKSWRTGVWHLMNYSMKQACATGLGTRRRAEMGAKMLWASCNSEQGPWQFVYWVSHRRWVMVSLQHPWKEKAIHAMEAWWNSSAKVISGSSLCYKADGHSLLRHGRNPDGGVASSGDYCKHSHLLQHPHTCLHQKLQQWHKEKWT
jgi:hypothetical protein